MKHLGSGKDYETYREVQPGLLEAVPRQQILKPIVFGQDVWNCYEFSCISRHGRPVVGVLKISYSASSENIIESKSLKLYLNSFNNVRFEDPLTEVPAKIQTDLKKYIPGYLSVEIFLNEEEAIYTRPIIGKFEPLDQHWYSPHHEGNYFTNQLRSNCRVTGQPDWADCYIHLKSKELYYPDSILDFVILPLRNENHFHEEACELIYKEIQRICMPDELFVACLYTRRGGIDINPVRASNVNLLYKHAAPLLNPRYLSIKSMRH